MTTTTTASPVLGTWNDGFDEPGDYEYEYETTETVAICPACRTPLLPTLEISKAEWQCPCCRRAFGLFDTPTVEMPKGTYEDFANKNRLT